MLKKILYSVLAAALIGGGIGYYLWNKPHVNMAKAKTDIAVDAKAIYDEYQADENAANAKYFDKVIAVKGTVKSVSGDEEGAVQVTLDTGAEFGVVCILSETAQHKRKNFNAGEQLTFKGHCSGLNFDVQFSDCVEVQ